MLYNVHGNLYFHSKKIDLVKFSIHTRLSKWQVSVIAQEAALLHKNIEHIIIIEIQQDLVGVATLLHAHSSGFSEGKKTPPPFSSV